MRRAVGGVAVLIGLVGCGDEGSSGTAQDVRPPPGSPTLDSVACVSAEPPLGVDEVEAAQRRRLFGLIEELSLKKIRR